MNHNPKVYGFELFILAMNWRKVDGIYKNSKASLLHCLVTNRPHFGCYSAGRAYLTLRAGHQRGEQVTHRANARCVYSSFPPQISHHNISSASTANSMYTCLLRAAQCEVYRSQLVVTNVSSLNVSFSILSTPSASANPMADQGSVQDERF